LSAAAADGTGVAPEAARVRAAVRAALAALLEGREAGAWAPAAARYDDLARRAAALRGVGLPGAPAAWPAADFAALEAEAAACGAALRGLEAHLAPDEFARVFELPPDAFAALPEWRRAQLRKKLRLEVEVA
jgi:hypothetical protein